MPPFVRHGLVERSATTLKTQPQAIGTTRHQQLESQRLGAFHERPTTKVYLVRQVRTYRALYDGLQRVAGVEAVDLFLQWAHSDGQLTTRMLDRPCLALAARQMMRPCHKTGGLGVGYRVSEWSREILARSFTTQAGALGGDLADTMYGLAMRGVTGALEHSAATLSNAGVCELCSPEEIRKIAVATSVVGARDALAHIAPEVELRTASFTVAQLASAVSAFALADLYPAPMFLAVTTHVRALIDADHPSVRIDIDTLAHLAPVCHGYAKYIHHLATSRQRYDGDDDDDDDNGVAAESASARGALAHLLRHVVTHCTAQQLAGLPTADLTGLVWASRVSYLQRTATSETHTEPTDELLDLSTGVLDAALVAHAPADYTPNDLRVCVWVLLLRGTLSAEALGFLEAARAHVSAAAASERLAAHAAVLELLGVSANLTDVMCA